MMTKATALAGLLLAGLAAAPVPAADARVLPVTVEDWFVEGCSSFAGGLADSQSDRVGVLVGQGHFGPDWEWGCLYRGPVFHATSLDVQDWFVEGCSSFAGGAADWQPGRIGVLVGQGHFGPDWEWGCLYRGPVSNLIPGVEIADE